MPAESLPESVREFARRLAAEPPTAARTAQLVIPAWLAARAEAEGFDLDEAANREAHRFGFAGARVVIADPLDDEDD